ncbi:gustatory receptor 68a-like [Homalodisca vitripennis]|uniref:gustatory receptor 68a-like n=1 Tax=Homalodisca vitripennis TaxID=197043 RepID=UPI001EEA5691|nr:gustatory receptor 68a-like [Homalodisca vitripennis]
MILDLVALQILAASTFFSGTCKYPRIFDVFGTLDRVYRDLQFQEQRGQGPSTTVYKIKKMKSLMNTYWMLCDAVHQANDFYCDQLMAVMFSLFVQVTIKSYFFFLHVRAGYMFGMTMDAVWVLVLICYAILVANSSTDITNSLEGFLLQLPHHNARFSARGFFQIHNETLTSMGGAVTTYLVILIQFQTEK